MLDKNWKKLKSLTPEKHYTPLDKKQKNTKLFKDSGSALTSLL